MNKILTLLILLLSATAQAQTADLPEPVKQMEKQGIEIIKPFSAPGGVEGWLGKYQDMGVTLYLTPDKKHVVSGYMYDTQGNNLSEKIINDEIYIPAGREMWKQLTAAPGISEGSADAKCQVVVFSDPFCPYCNKFWHQAQPFIKDKSISTKTLLVGVIRRTARSMRRQSSPRRIRLKPGMTLRVATERLNRRCKATRRLPCLSRYSRISSLWSRQGPAVRLPFIT